MPSAYPWGALEPVSREAERLASGARQRVRMSARSAGEVLSELLALPSEVVVRGTTLGRAPALAQVVWLGTGQLALGLLAEPALAAFLAARMLRHAEPLADPRAPLSPPLLGLVAALAVEGARRAGTVLALLEVPPVGDEALHVDVTLVLDGRPFSLSAFVAGGLGAPSAEPSLERLGALTLSIPLVIASTAIERAELLGLEPGGALLPGADASIDATGEGRGILVAPQGERGIAVEVRRDGRLVVREPAQARLTVERDKARTDEAETLTDVLLDTPIVVRVELGAVSMTAREWAQLGPGDVIETAQRIAEPVLLRVAGREVGRGELVNIDGQVGVRIQKLYQGGS